MKVLVVASLAYSLTNFRGALLAELRAQGHDVVACAPDHDDAVADALADMGARYVRVPMDRTGTSPLADLATLRALRRLMRIERPGVVLAYTQKPIVYAGLAARLSRRPVRFHPMVTGLGHAFSDAPGWRHGLVRRVAAFLYRAALADAAATFVFNPEDEAELRRRGILRPRHRVVRVPGSGIDLDRFARRPLPAGPPIFLLIARMLRDKGIVEFVAAARTVRTRWPSVRFRLLGPLDPNPNGLSYTDLDAVLDGSGVEYLEEARDVRPHLAEATVFVLPTYYREGLPRTILEAMATGRPIVTTDMPGCRDTVEPGGNGFLVPPRDAVALAGALERFVDDPALAPAMADRSRALAEERFDVRRVNRILLDAMFDGEDRVVRPLPSPRGLSDRPALEIPLALVMGLILLPVMAATALVVATALGRPVLFRQRRAGRNGRGFQLVKFRTMRPQAEGGAILPDADRLTGMGRLLRRTRLDELPELWNVVRGDMALVGPRPLLPDTVAAMARGGMRRGMVKPGLTGWAQVNGNVLLGDGDKLALDLWYIAHRSIRLDLRIVWRTIGVILFGERVDPIHVGRAYAGTADRGG